MKFTIYLDFLLAVAWSINFLAYVFGGFEPSRFTIAAAFLIAAGGFAYIGLDKLQDLRKSDHERTKRLFEKLSRED